MPGWNQPLLINILGHAAGAVIFAIFLVLLYSGRGWSGSHGRYLPGLAAALSLLWNLGSLVVLAAPGLPTAVAGVAGGVQLLYAYLAAGGVARNFAGRPKPRLGDRRLRARARPRR